MRVMDEISSRPPLRVPSHLITAFPAQAHPYVVGSCEQYPAENTGADGPVPSSWATLPAARTRRAAGQTPSSDGTVADASGRGELLQPRGWGTRETLNTSRSC